MFTGGLTQYDIETCFRFVYWKCKTLLILSFTLRYEEFWYQIQSFAHDQNSTTTQKHSSNCQPHNNILPIAKGLKLLFRMSQFVCTLWYRLLQNSSDSETDTIHNHNEVKIFLNRFIVSVYTFEVTCYCFDWRHSSNQHSAL